MVSVRTLLQDTAYVSKLPLSLSSISTNIEQTELILEDTEVKISITPEQLTKVDSIYALLTEELTIYQNRVSPETLGSLTAIELSEARSGIGSIDEKVIGFTNIIQNRINDLEIENKKLKDLGVIWETTQKAETTTEISATVKSKINELISRINLTSTNVQKALNYLLEIELRFNEVHVAFDKLYQDVNKAHEMVSKNIFKPDSDPLLILYSVSTDTIHTKTKIQNLISERKSELEQYYIDSKGTIILAVVLLVVLQFLFFITRHYVLKEHIEDKSQADNMALMMFKIPLFPALLIGLFIGSLILTNKPLILKQLVYLVAIVPFIIVLMKVLRGISRWNITILLLLFILSVISEMLYKVEIMSRTIMLINTIAAIIWIVVVTRMKIDILEGHPFLRNAIRFYIRLSLILLICCLIGNLLGYYTLNSILLFGIFASAFLGISLYVIDTLIIGSFVVLFNSPWGKQYRIIKMYKNDILKKIRRYSVFILTVLFLAGLLNVFLILDDVYNGISNFLNSEFSIGNFTFTVSDIVLFILILLITTWIARFIHFILQEQVLFKSKKQKDLSASISSLVKFIIITIGFILAALASGFPLNSITLLLSAFGVGIGFGLQNIFNNLVSGIILVFERPLQVGDTVEVGNLIGVVKSIGLRASTVRTFDGAEVIVPNGNLISNELINWTLSDSQRRIIVKVGVKYGSDPKKVKEILLKVAKKNKELLETPEPYVLFNEFGDSSLGFELRCYTDSNDWLIILSDLHVEVYHALHEAGIEIPFPQRDLHIKSMDPGVTGTLKSRRSAK